MLDDDESDPHRDPPRRSTVTDAESTWTAGIVVVSIAVAVTIIAWGVTENTRDLVIAISFMVLDGGMLVGAHISKRRALSILEDHRYRLCEHCAYGLSRIAPQGRCPECGRNYTWESAEAWWNAKYHPKEPEWMQGSGE